MRGTPEDFARQLTRDYWTWEGSPPRHWNLGPDRTLGVNFAGIDAAGRQLALKALDAWTAVSGIDFAETAGSAQIAFVDDGPGGVTTTRHHLDGELVSATVNVEARSAAASQAIGGVGYTYYLHEIGHALGLAHSGLYNGQASWADAVFENDSYLMSVMSYFDPSYDAAAATGYARPITPMPGDVAALRALYGTGTANPGDTVYGAGGNADGPLGLALAIAAGDVPNGGRLAGVDLVFTIVDTGGTDTIDASGFGAAQDIDLRPGATSTATGTEGGLAIAAGSIVENAIGGVFADRLAGNHAANRLSGGDGDDVLLGRLGADVLLGGSGYDALHGGGGHDVLYGEDGNDRLWGDGHGDALHGQGGDDRLWGGWGWDALHGGSGHDVLYGGDGNDRLWGDGHGDALHGQGGDDRLWGGWGWDALHGGSGHDVLYGGGGNDRLWGDGHGDVLHGQGGDDRLWGGWGWDRLFGGVGRDELRGGAGCDRLDGGAHDDMLTGGGQADTFVFRGAFGHDTVTDFATDEPGECLDLSGVAGIASYADLVAIHLGGLGGDTVIDDGAGNSITLSGVTPDALGADDFLF